MRFNEFKPLMEIKMTHKNLSELASKIPDALAGVEFEFVYPNGTWDKHDNVSIPEFVEAIDIPSLKADIEHYFRHDSESRIKQSILEILADYWSDETGDVPEELYTSSDDISQFYPPSDKFREWLEDVNMNVWKNLASRYRLTIPKKTDASKKSMYDVAQELYKIFGMPVLVSGKYHGTEKKSGRFYLEPDTSIKHPSVDLGVELVTPPLALNDMIRVINDFYAWAKSNGVYTNSSTGLHINISVPNYNQNDLDYTKLVLMSGDQHVLNQFSRDANTYAESSFEKIKIGADVQDDVESIFRNLKGKFSGMASKIIHSGITEKYTSINTREGWVEFRSPGGDYLKIDPRVIETTLLRYAVALDSACDPMKDREEYFKKMYKLLKPSETKVTTDVLKYFSMYSTGLLNRDTLKRALQNFRQNAEMRGNPRMREWMVQSSANPQQRVVVYAQSRLKALNIGSDKLGIEPHGLIATVIK